MSLRFKLHQLMRIAGDTRYLPFLLQRRVKRPAWRDRLGAMVANRRPGKAWADRLDPALAADLEANGISQFGRLLTPEQIADVRRHLEAVKIADPYQPQSTAFFPMANDRPSRTHVAYHEPADVLAAPHLLALANRPELLALAETFLGCKPTIGYFAAWWSFAAHDGAQAAEMFHRDVDDLKFIKLFVYLTDVDDRRGPHVYVRASSKVAKLDAIRRFDDAEVEDAFGKEAIMVLKGEAGEGFLENTYGIHKGTPVEEGYRLMFQAVYTLMPLPYAPRRPVGALSAYQQIAGVELDPFVNRLYLDASR